jgi:general secretion pathway protein D
MKTRSKVSIHPNSPLRQMHLTRASLVLAISAATFHVTAQPLNPFLAPAAQAQSAAQRQPVPAQAASQPAQMTQPGTIAPAAVGATAAPAAPVAISPALAPQAPAVMGMPARNTSSGISLRFDNADIYDVIQVVLGEILAVDYIVDPAVQGKVTLRSTNTVQNSDVLGVLQTALANVGVSVVKAGNGYKVVRDVNLARESLPIKGESAQSPVMRVIPLQFVQAAQVAATLKPFASAGGTLVPDPTNKYLIVADRAAVVDRLVSIVETLDNELLRNINVRMLRPANADPLEIAKELEALFKTSGLLNQPNADAVKAFFLPIQRLGAVLVASSSEVAILTAEKWFAILDAAPLKDADAMVHVYPVANGTAAHLAGIMQQIFGGTGGTQAGTSAANRQTGLSGASSTAPATPPASTTGLGGAGTTAAGQQASAGLISRGNVPQATASQIGSQAGLAGTVQIIPDEVTNSIIIRASAEDFNRIKKVLTKIDTLPKQVLIQVVVAEVVLNDTLQYGVEWWLNSQLSSNGRSWAAKAGLDGILKSPSTLGEVTGTGSGFNYAVLNGSSKVIGLFNLLSAPHVMAADGRIAKIEVGNDEPVVTQTVQAAASTLTGLSTSNSVQYRPTGLILEVKPTISANGIVSMAISQEVSSRIGSVLVGGSEYPSFSKRRVTTDVSVEEGKSLLIAGLIEDKGDDQSVGIPGAKDIPLFGALFGTSKKVKTKTELLITITPHIVNNAADADRVALNFSNALSELKNVVNKSNVGARLNSN